MGKTLEGEVMKTVYLVNPCDDFLERRGDRPPVGLLCLSAYLKQFNHNVKIFDLNHDTFLELTSAALDNQPNFLCVSLSTPNYKQSIEMIKVLRRVAPNCQFIAGGTHATDFPDELLTLLTFDHIIVGDGEAALLELVDNHLKLPQIIKRPAIALDDLPIPDYESVDMSRYTMTVDGEKGMLIATQRGCPFSCAFCGSANKPFIKPESVEKTITHMRLLYDKYLIRGFYFVDDTFTVNMKHSIALCNRIAEEFPDIVFRCTTRANCLTDDVCIALKKAGCTIASIGLESGDDQVLKNINKLETVAQQKKGVDMCHKHGLKVKGFFIFGLPGATYESELKTIQMGKELKVDYADAYIFTPYPGTPIWEEPEKFNMKIRKPKDNDWNNFFQVGKDGLPPTFQFEHPNLTEKQLRELVQKFKDEVTNKGLTY